MKQIKKAGVKEFFTVLFLIFIIIAAWQCVGLLMPSYGVIADILCFLCFIALGFRAISSCCAVFTYTLDEDKIKINRMIGKKNKETEFSTASVLYVSEKKPDTKYIQRYSPKLFNTKKSLYIVYDYNRLEQAVLIETDEEIKAWLRRFKTK